MYQTGSSGRWLNRQPLAATLRHLSSGDLHTWQISTLGSAPMTAPPAPVLMPADRHDLDGAALGQGRAFLAPEANFRRTGGYRELWMLTAALDEGTPEGKEVRVA